MNHGTSEACLEHAPDFRASYPQLPATQIKSDLDAQTCPMNSEVSDGVYWGALCSECAGPLLAELLHPTSPATYAVGCKIHGINSLFVSGSVAGSAG
jgi:hypothetical protein